MRMRLGFVLTQPLTLSNQGEAFLIRIKIYQDGFI